MAYGDQDKGILMADVEATAAKITCCELWQFNGDHFDFYDNGKVNQRCIETQLAFLNHHLSGQF